MIGETNAFIANIADSPLESADKLPMEAAARFLHQHLFSLGPYTSDVSHTGYLGAMLLRLLFRVCSLNGCTRCAIRCGVHGFAMNPYVSLRLATAPYYRETRVTVERRQTVCRMRHCCARRIDGCRGRRKLGCTSTRWAERQRIVGVSQIV